MTISVPAQFGDVSSTAQPHPSPPGGNISQPADSGNAKADETAITAARQALAAANSTVDTDKRNHSPGCVACDEKLVDKAEQQLAQAEAAAKAAQTGTGGLLDINM